MFDGPLFADPSGEGVGEDEGRFGKVAFQAAGGEPCVMSERGGSGGSGKLEAAFDAMRPGCDDGLGIKKRRGGFAGERFVEADEVMGAGDAAGDGGLEEALKIDSETGLDGAQQFPSGGEIGNAFAFEGYHGIDVRVALEQGQPFASGDPDEAAIGKA